MTRKTLLTLLDFVLATFTSPEAQSDGDVTKSVDGTELETAALPTPEQNRLRIKAELKTIAIILNNDGIRLSTLSLNTASVGLTLMGKTMRLGAKIGDMNPS